MPTRLLRRAWRRWSHAPGIRWIRGRPGTERLVQAFRHSLPLRRSLKFAIRELRCDGRVGCYALRETGAIACLRHNGADAWVLHEVFGKRCYEPPTEAAAILARVPRPHIVDVGAHVGFFGLFALARHPAARLVAIEPDPANAALLRECIRRNGRNGQWELIRACASVNDGSSWLAHGRGERSHVAARPGPDTTEVPTVDLFRLLEGVAWLKLDIEGAEWPLLADPRLAEAGPPLIVLEYHAHLCPESDPRLAATSRLEELGYAIQASGATAEPDVGVLWAWRPAPAGERGAEPASAIAASVT
jgi:FkbM family methyltransferase